MTKLEDEILDEASKELQEEIDWDILSDILNNTLGWTKVILPRYNSSKHAVDIHCWIEENCTGDVKFRGSIFLFENSKDAGWFSLRWL